MFCVSQQNIKSGFRLHVRFASTLHNDKLIFLHIQNSNSYTCIPTYTCDCIRMCSPYILVCVLLPGLNRYFQNNFFVCKKLLSVWWRCRITWSCKTQPAPPLKFLLVKFSVVFFFFLCHSMGGNRKGQYAVFSIFSLLFWKRCSQRQKWKSWGSITKDVDSHQLTTEDEMRKSCKITEDLPDTIFSNIRLKMTPLLLRDSDNSRNFFDHTI